MRFFALQRFRPGRSTVRGLYLPALVRPQGLVTLSTACSRPNLAALFQTGCVPGLDPSEVAHACGGAAFLPFRSDRMVSNPSADPCKHVNTAGFAITRLCPASMPVVRRQMLLRHLARASPGLLLPGVCSSIGLAGSSASRLPLACPPPVTRVTDCHSAFSNRSTIPIREITGHSR
jgi:hypothetical protein